MAERGGMRTRLIKNGLQGGPAAGGAGVRNREVAYGVGESRPGRKTISREVETSTDTDTAASESVEVKAKMR